MSPAFTSRRRAEEFDALVTARSTSRSAGPARLRDLVGVVEELRALPAPVPRPEFSAALRERLMTEADTALATLDPAVTRLQLPVRRPVRDRRIATLIGGAALLGATTSMAVAAQSALPGDSLYPVKRALEDAGAGMAGDDTARGQALLDNATGRLEEVNALALRGTDDGIAAVPVTLVEFTEQSLEGSGILLRSYDETGDDQVIAQLRDFTHDSMETLLALETWVPASARDEFVEAARTLTEIDDRARALCPACGGAGITEVPPFLLTASTLPTAAVTQVAVPAATRPRRPDSERTAAQTSGTDHDGGISLPEVELDDPQPPAGQTGGAQDGGGQDQGTQDPVRELTSTLTKSETASTDEPATGLLDEVDEVDKVLESTTDSLLD